jgi:exodeoxyribonuclease-3
MVRRPSTASLHAAIDEVAPGLIGDDADVQARFLEAIVSTKTGALRDQPLSAQWQPPNTDKYAYKLN